MAGPAGGFADDPEVNHGPSGSAGFRAARACAFYGSEPYDAAPA